MSASESALLLRDPRVGLKRLYTLSFITALSGAMMPGPLLVVTIEQTSVQGMRAVLGLITGHALIEVVIVGLLVAGMQQVIARPRVRGAIGLVGGIALLYMGADMLRNAFGLSLQLDQTATKAYSMPKLILAGILVSLANPYFTGWWATIGAGQLAYSAPETKSEYAAFYFGHETGDYLWYSIVGVLVITGRKWLSDSFFQWLIVACGIVIVLLGVKFVLTGFRFARIRSEPATA